MDGWWGWGGAGADPPGATLAEMLADGQIDALYTPRVPRGFGEGRVRRRLYKAFEQARREAAARLAETAAGASLLPWAYADAERTRNVMGADFWTYGLAGNEPALRTFGRYSFEQGLIRQQPDPAELFAPETREAFVI